MKIAIIGGSLPSELRNGHNRTDGYSRAVWNIARSISTYFPELEIYYVPFHLTKSMTIRNIKVQEVSFKRVLLNLLLLHQLRNSFNYLNRFVPYKKRLEVLGKNMLIAAAVNDLIKTTEIELFHIHGVTPEFYAFNELIRTTGKPILLTLHGIYSQDPNIKTWFNKSFEFDACISYLNAGATISTVSEFTSLELEGYISLKNHHIKFIENSIEQDYFTKPFTKSKLYKKNIRKKLGIPENAMIALSVGTISPRKNQRIFIQAMSEFDSRDLCFALIGKEPNNSFERRLVSRLGLEKRVIFLGTKETKELIDIYDSADFFVHLPTSEGFGLVFAEALARRLPILTYKDLPFVKKYLDDDVAVILENLRLDTVIKGIKRIIKRVRNRDFDREKMHSLSLKFKPEFMALNYFNLYKEIINYKV